MKNKITQDQWIRIGHVAGWLPKTAQHTPNQNVTSTGGEESTRTRQETEGSKTFKIKDLGSAAKEKINEKVIQQTLVSCPGTNGMKIDDYSSGNIEISRNVRITSWSERTDSGFSTEGYDYAENTTPAGSRREETNDCTVVIETGPISTDNEFNGIGPSISVKAEKEYDFNRIKSQFNNNYKDLIRLANDVINDGSVYVSIHVEPCPQAQTNNSDSIKLKTDRARQPGFFSRLKGLFGGRTAESHEWVKTASGWKITPM